MARLFSKISLLTIGLCFLPLGSQAETVFMVQLGAFDTEEKASAH